MEANGVFPVEMEMNGRYSFRSLLLDEEGIDDASEMAGEVAQLVLTGDLDAVDETLYSDEIGLDGRESFKSLLLEEDEIHFSPADQQVELENGNHVQVSMLPSPTTAPEAEVFGTEEAESFSKENHAEFDCIEVAQVEESIAPLPRKRRRGNCPNLLIARESNVEQVPEIVLQPRTLPSPPPPQPSKPPPPPATTMKKQAEKGTNMRPFKKKKPPVGNTDVQRLFDSVVAQQELFFSDLLESMERKEAVRERMREEKEEKWRAEERAQLCVINNAMLALSQELMGESKMMDKAK